jgi:NAD(P)-dependent dehydrogenase (short-subunit alcohol dehydrogenase family)
VKDQKRKPHFHHLSEPPQGGGLEQIMALYEDLAGKVAIVTGASGGLGKAAVKQFLASGMKVTLVGTSQEKLDCTIAEIGGTPENTLAVPTNVAVEADVKNYVDKTIAKFGQIDVFFNNAGIEGKVAPIVDQTVEDFNKVIDTNVRGCWMGLHFVLPHMYARKQGSVIDTSSIGGISAGPMPVSPYVTSKFAITGMTRIAAVESAPYNVRVNSIHPSPAETRMMDSLEAGSGASTEAISASIPMGRYAKPEEVANLVLFLASDQSSFITGGQYVIDGGMLA